ncbi:hypothetical protein B0H10DRAFT_2133110 [Mycena sp. CBHHK59/15]|nr:hypothetical protein B0H10DRAFT_2133110 [Mycena sp. CBHHK59/15]
MHETYGRHDHSRSTLNRSFAGSPWFYPDAVRILSVRPGCAIVLVRRRCRTVHCSMGRVAQGPVSLSSPSPSWFYSPIGLSACPRRYVVATSTWVLLQCTDLNTPRAHFKRPDRSEERAANLQRALTLLLPAPVYAGPRWRPRRSSLKRSLRNLTALMFVQPRQMDDVVASVLRDAAANADLCSVSPCAEPGAAGVTISCHKPSPDHRSNWYTTFTHPNVVLQTL